MLLQFPDASVVPDASAIHLESLPALQMPVGAIVSPGVIKKVTPGGVMCPRMHISHIVLPGELQEVQEVKRMPLTDTYATNYLLPDSNHPFCNW